MIETQHSLRSESPTVFVIDDDPAVRQSVCMLVESSGHHVAAFDSAQAFLDIYTPDQTGCVVTEVRLPGMSGVQLQEELSDRGFTIPVILMTGYGDVATAVRALKAGAIDFLEKPFTGQVLLDLIEDAVKMDGNVRWEDKLRDAARTKFDTLTPREQQVMTLIVQGHSNRQMSDALEITTKTIEAHRAKVMKKMSAGSVAELTQLDALCD